MRLWTTGPGLRWDTATLDEVSPLLAAKHYLGPMHAARHVFAGFVDGELVAAQIWRWPTARHLPGDGTWLELSRWCLTDAAGGNAGSQMQGWVNRWVRRNRPEVTTLVSYSDPSQGHSGSLYRACGWEWCPTRHRLRPPPSGNGSWSGVQQSVKDRWMFPLRQDERRDAILAVKDAAAASRYAAPSHGDEGGSQPTPPLHLRAAR